jgi:hypothetical protein
VTPGLQNSAQSKTRIETSVLPTIRELRVSVSLTTATSVDDVTDQLLVDVFLESQEKAPQIILDLDV